MPVDALTLAAVADELREKAVGGRIQAVFLPASLAIGLEIYAHHATQYLFASAHPQHARVHLTPVKLSRGTEDVTPLLLMLRKYVRDGRLAAVEQPPLERVLTLIITKTGVLDKRQFARGLDEHVEPARTEDESVARPGGPPEVTTVRLIIEIMGRYSNIVLVNDEGLVMEAVKHVSADVNRYRVTLPRHPYVPPPPQEKADPRTISVMSLGSLLSTAGDRPTWQLLVQSCCGISPLLAREIVFRTTGTSDAPANKTPAERLAAAMADLLALQHTHQWSPSLVREDDAILDFAPYLLTQFGGRTVPVASISEAIHAYYMQETVAAEYSGLKQEVAKILATQRERVLRRRESLEAQRAVGEQANDLRTKGELLLAYAAQVTPGSTEANIVLTPDEPPVRITLDPRLTVVENAQAYFKRYVQAREAARSIPPLLEEVAADLAMLEQLGLDLDMARTVEEVREVKQALMQMTGEGPSGESVSAARSRTPRGDRGKTGKGSSPLVVTSADGMEIVVGRNARQNDYVTFDLASPDDLWLHARGVAGSHVIVRSGGRPVSPATLQQAAALAAAHSAARDSTSVAVDYTQRRNVRRMKGHLPGLVTYTNEKTIHVQPAHSDT